MKTNAVRLLEKAGIPFETVSYPVDPEDLSAGHVAGLLGQNPRQVFKTLVVRGNGKNVLVCLVPGSGELDLKKAAKHSGHKRAEMVRMNELLPLTGYIRGGCTPVGMKKSYPVLIDESCLDFDSIFISAGIRGMQIELAPADLIRFTRARTVPLTL